MFFFSRLIRLSLLSSSNPFSLSLALSLFVLFSLPIHFTLTEKTGSRVASHAISFANHSVKIKWIEYVALGFSITAIDTLYGRMVNVSINRLRATQ